MVWEFRDWKYWRGRVTTTRTTEVNYKIFVLLHHFLLKFAQDLNQFMTVSRHCHENLTTLTMKDINEWLSLWCISDQLSIIVWWNNYWGVLSQFTSCLSWKARMWYGATYRMSQNKKSTPYLNVFLEKNQPFFFGHWSIYHVAIARYWTNRYRIVEALCWCLLLANNELAILETGLVLPAIMTERWLNCTAASYH